MATNNNDKKQLHEVHPADVHDVHGEDFWENPSLLDTRNIPRKAGYIQRWVRTTIKGEVDYQNVMKMHNYGWRTRPIESIEHAAHIPRVDFNGSSVIGIQGNILMERPEAVHERQTNFYRKDTMAQIDAVKHNAFSQVPVDERYVKRAGGKTSLQVETGTIADPD